MVVKSVKLGYQKLHKLKPTVHSHFLSPQLIILYLLEWWEYIHIPKRMKHNFRNSSYYTTSYYLFPRNTDPIINKITKNIGRLILLSFSTLSKFLYLMSFNVNLIQSLNFWTLVNIPGLPAPYFLQSSLVSISEGFRSRLWKTFFVIQIRDIRIECSKQFKWNWYFYVSGLSWPFWA